MCCHIDRYYRSTISKPPDIGAAVSWEIQPDELPLEIALKASESSTGDPCHHDLMNFSRSSARAFFKKYWEQLSNFKICDGKGRRREVKAEDLDPWDSKS